MKLRGKDYCNCEHAQMLREALNDACYQLERDELHDHPARLVLLRALGEDYRAAILYQKG